MGKKKEDCIEMEVARPLHRRPTLTLLVPPVASTSARHLPERVHAMLSPLPCPGQDGSQSPGADVGAVVQGTVTESLPNAMFRVELEANKQVAAPARAFFHSV